MGGCPRREPARCRGPVVPGRYRARGETDRVLEFVRLISRHQVTVTFTPNFLLDLVDTAISALPDPVANWTSRACGTSSATARPWSGPRARRFRNCSPATACPPPRWPVTTTRRCPRARPIASGYYNNPEATADAFTSDFHPEMSADDEPGLFRMLTAVRSSGAQDLAWVRIDESGKLTGPIAKFLTDNVVEQLVAVFFDRVRPQSVLDATGRS